MMASIYMEYCEKICLSPLKRTVWQRYVGDAFIFWYDQQAVEIRLNHMNSIKPSIRFTMKEENGNYLPFLEVLIMCTDNVFKGSLISQANLQWNT